MARGKVPKLTAGIECYKCYVIPYRFPKIPFPQDVIIRTNLVYMVSHESTFHRFGRYKHKTINTAKRVIQCSQNALGDLGYNEQN